MYHRQGMLYVCIKLALHPKGLYASGQSCLIYARLRLTEGGLDEGTTICPQGFPGFVPMKTP